MANGLHTIFFQMHFYTPTQRSWKGGILESGCPSVRLSVCPSVDTTPVTRPGPKGPHRDNPVKSSNLRIAAFVTGLDSVRRQNGPIKYRSFISQEHQAISIRGTRCLVWNKVSWWRKWLAMNNQTGWGLNSTLRAEVVNVDSSREYSSNWQRFWAHQRLIFHSRWSPSS